MKRHRLLTAIALSPSAMTVAYAMWYALAVHH